MIETTALSVCRHYTSAVGFSIHVEMFIMQLYGSYAVGFEIVDYVREY